MKRIILAALCIAVTLGLAVPAFAADHEVSGFLNVGAYTTDVSFTKDAKPQRFVDQRFRAKWTVNVNEYVSVVYYGEIDMNRGGESYGAGTRNTGGGIGGDSVNLETKNVFFSFKAPDFPLSAKVGLQGWKALDYALYLFDATGIMLSHKGDNYSAALGWVKAKENDNTGEDDIDVYVLSGGFKPMDALSMNVGLHWLKDQTANSDLYTLSVEANFKADNFYVKGWLAPQFGTDEGATDTDFGGIAATVKGGMDLGDIDVAARVIYMSSDDDMTDDEDNTFHFYGENLAFAGNNQLLMLADGNLGNFVPYSQATKQAGYMGYGLAALVLNCNYTPAAMKNLYVKAGLGYYEALEDDLNPADNTTADPTHKEGTSLGTELAVSVGYKVAGVDFSFNASQVMLGDFFDTNGGDDPDNPYTAYIMAKVPF